MPPPPLKRWSITSAFFVRLRREVELELPQRRRVHRADVQVADLAVAQLRRPSRGDRRPTCAYCRSLNAPPATGVIVDVPRAFLRRLVVQHEVELAARREREVAASSCRSSSASRSSTRDDVVARRDLQVVVIGRTVLVDVADLVEAGRIGDEIESRAGASARVGRCVGRTAAARRCATRSARRSSSS